MRSDELYLRDIVEAAETIERFLAGIDRKTFLADEMRQSAVLLQTKASDSYKFTKSVSYPPSLFSFFPVVSHSQPIRKSCESESNSSRHPCHGRPFYAIVHLTFANAVAGLLTAPPDFANAVAGLLAAPPDWGTHGRQPPTNRQKRAAKEPDPPLQQRRA